MCKLVLSSSFTDYTAALPCSILPFTALDCLHLAHITICHYKISGGDRIQSKDYFSKKSAQVHYAYVSAFRRLSDSRSPSTIVYFGGTPCVGLSTNLYQTLRNKSNISPLPWGKILWAWVERRVR